MNKRNIGLIILGCLLVGLFGVLGYFSLIAAASLAVVVALFALIYYALYLIAN